jgi:hypothetical protein
MACMVLLLILTEEIPSPGIAEPQLGAAVNQFVPKAFFP